MIRVALLSYDGELVYSRQIAIAEAPEGIIRYLGRSFVFGGLAGGVLMFREATITEWVP